MIFERSIAIRMPVSIKLASIHNSSLFGRFIFISLWIYLTSNFGEISTVPFACFLARSPIESLPSFTEKDGEILTLFVLVRVFCFRTFVGSCLAITDIAVCKHSAIQDIFSRVFSGLLTHRWESQGKHRNDAKNEFLHNYIDYNEQEKIQQKGTNLTTNAPKDI